MNQNKLFLKQEKKKNRRKEGRKQVEVKNRYKPTPQQLTASSQPETAPTASSQRIHSAKQPPQRVHSEFTARNSPHSEFTASSQRIHSEFTARNPAGQTLTSKKYSHNLFPTRSKTTPFAGSHFLFKTLKHGIAEKTSSFQKELARKPS